jgi:hypothetical protein
MRRQKRLPRSLLEVFLEREYLSRAGCMRVFSPPFDALTPSRIPYSAEDLNLIARTIVENPDLPPKGYQIAEFLAQRNARHSKHSYQTFISGNWPTLRNKAKEMEHANRRAQARAQAEGEQADSLGSQPVGRQRQLIQEEGPSQAESLEEGELREDRESITFSRPTLPSNSAAANIRRPLPSQGPPIGSTRFRPPVAAAGRGRSPVPPMRRSKSPAQPRRRSRSPQILARRTTPPAPLFGGDAEDEEVDAALTPAVPATGVARAAARTDSGRSTAMRTTSGASKSDYESAAEDVSADAALGGRCRSDPWMRRMNSAVEPISRILMMQSQSGMSRMLEQLEKLRIFWEKGNRRMMTCWIYLRKPIKAKSKMRLMWRQQDQSQ